MVIKYSKLLTVASAPNHKPDTILVKYIESERFQGVSMESLDGEYYSTEDFYKTVDHFFDYLKRVLDKAKPYVNPHAKEDKVKNYNSLLLSTHEARQLADALNEALQAAQES